MPEIDSDGVFLGRLLVHPVQHNKEAGTVQRSDRGLRSEEFSPSGRLRSEPLAGVPPEDGNQLHSITVHIFHHPKL